MKIDDSIEGVRKFVNNELNTLVKAVKPHLSCEFALGKDISLTKMDEYKAQRIGVSSPYSSREPYVLIHCENGYRYEVNIDGNSLAATAEAVVGLIVCK